MNKNKNVKINIKITKKLDILFLQKQQYNSLEYPKIPLSNFSKTAFLTLLFSSK
jgi:hypothetical protein